MLYSHKLFTQAQAVIPGGVNSPVRAFKGVGGEQLNQPTNITINTATNLKMQINGVRLD